MSGGGEGPRRLEGKKRSRGGKEDCFGRGETTVLFADARPDLREGGGVGLEREVEKKNESLADILLFAVGVNKLESCSSSEMK